MSLNLQKTISPLFTENVPKQILQRYSGLEDVTVNEVNCEKGDQTKGYSYLSNVVKLRIHGTARNRNGDERKLGCDVFVKIQPTNIARSKSFRTPVFFRNEVVFYNDVWTTIMKFQETKNVKNKFNHLPLCLSAVTDGKNDYIALEDLSTQNYTSFRKEKEMDYETVISIIRMFARFHALSFAFKDQFPKEFKRMANIIEETYFHEKYRDWFVDYQKSLLKIAHEAIEKELPSFYLQKYEELVNNDLFGRVCKICAKIDDKLSVISQGDAWIPNFLGKFDENNKLVDIKLVDFQLARCCPPSCDISFFLYSCTSYKLYNTYWDDIMKEYHSTFTDFLSELGSDPKIFSYEDFKADMKDNAVLGCAMAIEAIPNQQMDEKDIPDLDVIEGDEAIPLAELFKIQPFKTKEGRLMLANVFKHVVDNDFL